MGLAEQLDITVNFFQNLSLILKLDIEWPESITFVGAWLRAFVNWDAFQDTFLLQVFPVTIDHRVKFLAINIVFPMLISFLLFFPFKKLKVTFWYLIIILGVSLLGAAMTLLLYLIRGAGRFRFAQLVPYPYPYVICAAAAFVGLSMSLCCVLVAVLYAFRRNSRLRSFARALKIRRSRTRDVEVEEDVEANTDVMRKRKRDALRLRLCPFSVQLLFSMACTFGGAALVTWVLVTDKDLSNFSQPRLFVLVPLGCFIILFGLILFGVTTFQLCLKGRRTIYNIKKFFIKHVLKFLFLFLTMSYVPLATSTFSVFDCQQVGCPTGTTFNQKPPFTDIQQLFYTDKNISQCVGCNFFTHETNGTSQCPLDLQMAICPYSEQFRLRADKLFPCHGDMYYFWAAAVVTGMAFIVGTPIVMCLLVKKSTDFMNSVDIEHLLFYLKQHRMQRNWKYKTKAEVEKLEKTHKEEDQWDIRVMLIPCSIESLYFSFKFKYRFFKLVRIAEKLALAAGNTLIGTLLSLIAKGPWQYTNLVIICINIFVHFSMGAITIVLRPHIYFLETMLSFVASLLNFINSLFALLVFFGYPVPPWASTVVIFANAAVFLLATAFAVIIFVYRRKTSIPWRHVQQEMMEQYPATIKERKEQQKLAKEALNKSTLAIVLNFLMFMGGCCILGLAVLVSVYFSDNKPYTPSMYYDEWTTKQSVRDFFSGLETTSKDTVTRNLFPLVYLDPQFPHNKEGCRQYFDFEFAGYASWQHFTDNCCCEHHLSEEQRQPGNMIELWSCTNGRKKQRYRKVVMNGLVDTQMNVELDGQAIRPFCSKYFNGYMSLQNERQVAWCERTANPDKPFLLYPNATRAYVNATVRVPPQYFELPPKQQLQVDTLSQVIALKYLW